MLAAGHISKMPRQFGFDSIAYQDPLAFDTVWVSTQSSLDLVARAANVDTAAVRDLNPHLVKGVTPPGRAYPVRIPRDTRFTFVHNFAALMRREMQAEQARLAAAQLEGKRHTIRRGETLNRIAQRYDVSVASLMSVNTGLSARGLQPGKVLTIPGSAKTAASAQKPANVVKKTGSAVSKKTASVVHRVQRGENLSAIAERYDTSVTRIRSLNGLGRRSRIYPGQRLRIS
jgi:LysM repeat protein